MNNFWPINVSQKIVCNLWEDRRWDFLHPVSRLAVWNVNLMAEAVWLHLGPGSDLETVIDLERRHWAPDYEDTMSLWIAFLWTSFTGTKKILYCYLAICNLLLSSSFYHLKLNLGTTLMVQWLGIHFVMKAIWVPSQVQEDPPCLRATKPMLHTY